MASKDGRRGSYNNPGHSKKPTPQKADPLESVVKTYKKRRNGSKKKSHKNITQGGKQYQICTLTKPLVKNPGARNLSCRRRRPSKPKKHTRNPSAEAEASYKRRPSSESNFGVTKKDSSLDSRNQSLSKRNKIKQNMLMNNRGSTSSAKGLSSPLVKTIAQSCADAWRPESLGATHQGSYPMRESSTYKTSEEIPHKKSTERGSTVRNIKMSAFLVSKHPAGEGVPPVAKGQVKTSLFAFLQKLQEKGLNDRLERGYLLLDRKGRIIPNYKSEIKNQQSTVIAFWISGDNYPTPTSLGKNLLKKVKEKLLAK